MGCLAGTLAGAGGGEIFEDESVGHCCGGRWVRGLTGFSMW